MSNQPKVSVVIVSKLTSKAQTTIPRSIRSALGLQPGDEISYEIVDGRVTLDREQREPRRTTRSAPSRNGARKPIPRPMPTFERGDVIKLPLPHSDRATR